jgi:response regulator RpfG family c-di-GMP phosphodiesterase
MSETATAAATQPIQAEQRPVVLLVDDEPSVLSALRRLFRTQGYQIEQATSGADALALLEQQPVDLVICDMRMPEMDGASLLEAVRIQHPGSVRILLTGYSDIGATVAAINRGEIHRYIAKPWDDQDLLLVVRDALRRAELERQNASLQALTQQQNLELQAKGRELQQLNQALQDANQTLEARVLDRTHELEQSLRLLATANADLDAQFMLAVTVFSGLLEMRQDGMAGHARRVGELARSMASRLGLDGHAQRDVHLAALLHDIGKIGYPDAMLDKPVSKYSPDELQCHHQHTLDGESALMALAQLQGVALIVRQHHERVDGRGFPDGLMGGAISLGAKIVTVASDYDALTSGSLAEQAYAPAQARQAMLDGLGTHYELKVLTALIATLAEIEAAAIADVEVEVADLRPKMVLSTDLLSAQGSILLPKGFKFDSTVIAKVTAFASRTNLRLVVRVLQRSIEALPHPGAPATGPGAHK